MSDLRDAMKKAGVVSEKQVRQAKHGDRVHHKEVGAQGLAAEREQRDAAFAAEQERRGREDAEREKARQAQQEAQGQPGRLPQLVRANDLALQEAGPRRFYFALPSAEVAFVDVSDALARRLAQGDVAIVDGAGILERDFGLVTGKIAREIEGIDRSRILLWNARV
jgi:uncharacterized protein YaiL (DUF2058 family)